MGSVGCGGLEERDTATPLTTTTTNTGTTTLSSHRHHCSRHHNFLSDIMT